MRRVDSRLKRLAVCLSILVSAYAGVALASEEMDDYGWESNNSYYNSYGPSSSYRTGIPKSQQQQTTPRKTYRSQSSSQYYEQPTRRQASYSASSFEARLPSHITTSEKVIIVDPNVHAWGAYDSSGNILKGGMASAGANYCPDIHRRCHTKSGSFRIFSLGGSGCKSSIYPLPHGGAPMPYCMFFNKNQALHGSPASHVVDGNVSHGCVRLHVEDAEWIRFNFANVGTKVIVRPY